MQEPSAFTLTLNHYLALGTIIGLVLAVIFAIYITVLMLQKKESAFTRTISKNVLPLGFFITLGGTFLTLYYQYGLGYAPCDLCWYQRIFLYSQMFMFGLAWWKKDRNVLPYSFILSVVGFAIAVYHHMLQIGYNIYKPCSTAPFAVDCAKPSFVEFGFVTFPFMAVVLFAFILLIIVTATKISQRS